MGNAPSDHAHGSQPRQLVASAAMRRSLLKGSGSRRSTILADSGASCALVAAPQAAVDVGNSATVSSITGGEASFLHWMLHNTPLHQHMQPAELHSAQTADKELFLILQPFERPGTFGCRLDAACWRADVQRVLYLLDECNADIVGEGFVTLKSEPGRLPPPRTWPQQGYIPRHLVTARSTLLQRVAATCRRKRSCGPAERAALETIFLLVAQRTPDAALLSGADWLKHESMSSNRYRDPLLVAGKLQMASVLQVLQQRMDSQVQRRPMGVAAAAPPPAAGQPLTGPWLGPLPGDGDHPNPPQQPQNARVGDADADDREADEAIVAAVQAASLADRGNEARAGPAGAAAGPLPPIRNRPADIYGRDRPLPVYAQGHAGPGADVGARVLRRTFHAGISGGRSSRRQ